MNLFCIRHHKDGTQTIYVNTKRHGEISIDDLIDKIDKVLDRAQTEKDKEV